MKKVLKYLIIVIVCFSLSLFFISAILNNPNNMEKIKNFIETNDFIKVNVSLDKIMKCIKVVISALLANFIGIIDFFCKRKDKNRNRGIISVCIINTSIVKKEVEPKYYPIVEVGTGNSFVYIKIEIKNIGQSLIDSISCQDIVVYNSFLEINQATDFFIKINKSESNSFNQKYKIKVIFSEINRKTYCCKANILYDENLHCFNISYNKPERILRNGKNKN